MEKCNQLFVAGLALPSGGLFLASKRSHSHPATRMWPAPIEALGAIASVSTVRFAAISSSFSSASTQSQGFPRWAFTFSKLTRGSARGCEGCRRFQSIPIGPVA